jgi:hypothetical protein
VNCGRSSKGRGTSKKLEFFSKRWALLKKEILTPPVLRRLRDIRYYLLEFQFDREMRFRDSQGMGPPKNYLRPLDEPREAYWITLFYRM